MGQDHKGFDTRIVFGYSPEENYRKSLVEVCGPIEEMRGKVVLELFSGGIYDSLGTIFRQAGAEYHSVDKNYGNVDPTRHTLADVYGEIALYQKKAFDYVIMSCPTFWGGKKVDGIPSMTDPDKVAGLLTNCLLLLKEEVGSSVIVAWMGKEVLQYDRDRLNPELVKNIADAGLNIRDWKLDMIRFGNEGVGIKITRKMVFK